MNCLDLLVEFCLELPQSTTPLVVRQSTHLIKHMCVLGKKIPFTTSNLSTYGHIGVPTQTSSLWYTLAQPILELKTWDHLPLSTSFSYALVKNPQTSQKIV
jgi:hypothetical protein